MDIAALFFTLAILVLVALYLYVPLARRYARPIIEEKHELSALLAERDRVINALQELDFDFKLGKIPSEDYPTQRTNLLQKGADILRKIDELSQTDGSKNEDAQHSKEFSPRQKKLRETALSTVPDSAEDRLEQAIAERRVEVSTRTRERTDEDIESMISVRRMKRKEKSAGFCPKCGKPVLQSDRFCPACGKALT